jgi:hypothetical protein
MMLKLRISELESRDNVAAVKEMETLVVGYTREIEESRTRVKKAHLEWRDTLDFYNTPDYQQILETITEKNKLIEQLRGSLADELEKISIQGQKIHGMEQDATDASRMRTLIADLQGEQDRLNNLREALGNEQTE